MKLLRLLEKGQLRLLCGGICRAVERAVSRVNHRCETSAVSKFGDGTFHISFTYGKILKEELIAEGEIATIKSKKIKLRGDLSSRESIQNLIAEGRKYGEIKMLVNAAGVSPSQAPIEAILKVDLYGTAVLLEEVGKVIADGGVGVTISSQSGWRMPALTAEQDAQLATTPTEGLLSLDFLQPENIRDTLHAYQLAKHCNEKRVMAQAVEWGKRSARLNNIAPGIIVTPLALDEFNGPRGDFYKNMFAQCPAGRPGTADEVANVAELLMSDKGTFISGSTFLIDGGATASYYYGPLTAQPLSELVDKIIVHETKGTRKKRTPRVEICGRFVDGLDIPEISRRSILPEAYPPGRRTGTLHSIK